MNQFPFHIVDSLRSKRFQSSYSAKVRAGTKKMEGGGGGEKRGGFLPPPPLIPFFLLSSQLSQRTRAETLAMQATSWNITDFYPYWS